jgi:hypothetical protein
MVKWKTVPPPGLSLIQMRPPCASIIERQIDNPTPIPAAFVVTNGFADVHGEAGPGVGDADLSHAIGSRDRLDRQRPARGFAHNLPKLHSTPLSPMLTVAC